jgi:hypothetical protein
MSPSIKQKTAISVFLVALVLACFAISRSVQAAQPLDVQNVNVFNTPFQQIFSVELMPDQTAGEDTVDIPAGKTLVVEFVSARSRCPAGEQLILLELGSNGAFADLLWNFQASTNDKDFFVASQQIRLYAKHSLRMTVARDVGVGFGRVNGSVIGYLVNTP